MAAGDTTNEGQPTVEHALGAYSTVLHETPLRPCCTGVSADMGPIPQCHRRTTRGRTDTVTRVRETEGNGRRVAKGLRKGDGTPGRSRSRRVPAQVIIECFQVTAVICSTIADLCLSAGLGLCRT